MYKNRRKIVQKERKEDPILMNPQDPQTVSESIRRRFGGSTSKSGDRRGGIGTMDRGHLSY